MNAPRPSDHAEQSLNQRLETLDEDLRRFVATGIERVTTGLAQGTGPFWDGLRSSAERRKQIATASWRGTSTVLAALVVSLLAAFGVSSAFLWDKVSIAIAEAASLQGKLANLRVEEAALAERLAGAQARADELSRKLDQSLERSREVEKLTIQAAMIAAERVATKRSERIAIQLEARATAIEARLNDNYVALASDSRGAFTDLYRDHAKLAASMGVVESDVGVIRRSVVEAGVRADQAVVDVIQRQRPVEIPGWGISVRVASVDTDGLKGVVLADSTEKVVASHPSLTYGHRQVIELPHQCITISFSRPFGIVRRTVLVAHREPRLSLQPCATHGPPTLADVEATPDRVGAGGQ